MQCAGDVTGLDIARLKALAPSSQKADYREAIERVRQGGNFGDVTPQQRPVISAAALRSTVGEVLEKTSCKGAVFHCPVVKTDESFVALDHAVFTPAGNFVVADVSTQEPLRFCTVDGESYPESVDVSSHVRQVVQVAGSVPVDVSAVIVAVGGKGMCSVSNQGFIANSLQLTDGVTDSGVPVLFLPVEHVSRVVEDFVSTSEAVTDWAEDFREFSSVVLPVRGSA